MFLALKEAENLRLEKEAVKKDAEELEKVALDAYRKLQDERDKAQREEENESNEAEALSVFNLLDSNQDHK